MGTVNILDYNYKQKINPLLAGKLSGTNGQLTQEESEAI